MPKYLKKESGDFSVELKPVGIHSKFLFKTLMPYFAGSEPSMKLSITSDRERAFIGELYCFDPEIQSNSVAHYFKQIDGDTPYQAEIKLPMLIKDGNYQLQVTINSLNAKGGDYLVAMFPCKTIEIIVWNNLERFIFLIMGAALGLIPFIIDKVCSKPTP